MRFRSVLFHCLAFVLLIGFSKQAFAASRASANSGFNSFLGAANNFVFPGTIRVGWGDWEFGMLSPSFVGFDKVFSLGANTYSSFGIGGNADGYKAGVGIQIGAGFHYEIIWGVGLRGEVMAKSISNGAGIAHGLLGLSYGF